MRAVSSYMYMMAMGWQMCARCKALNYYVTEHAFFCAGTGGLVGIESKITDGNVIYLFVFIYAHICSYVVFNVK